MSHPLPPGGVPRRSDLRTHGSLPAPAADDPDFLTALQRLASLPRAERRALAGFIFFWLALPRERRAMLAKAVRPEMTDDEVARMIGRSLRQLYRYDGYQHFKPRRDDLRGSKRYCGFSNPDDPEE